MKKRTFKKSTFSHTRINCNTSQRVTTHTYIANENSSFSNFRVGHNSYKTIILSLSFIIVSTFIVFSPTLNNGLINWDDDTYIVNNPLLHHIDGTILKRMFSEFYMGNYHPLTMLSLAVDYKVCGINKDGTPNAMCYHITALLLHILCSVLIFWFVYVLFHKREIALIAGVLFGIHALHVESVAWASERKDVLYAVFFMAALIGYVYYLRTQKIIYLLFTLLLYILSLLSKGQAVSLALSLIAIDYVTEQKLLTSRLIYGKLPFLILAAIFGYIAIEGQKAGEALQDIHNYEFYKRIGFAGYAFSMYILKLFLPINLSAIYPYPDNINRGIPDYYWSGMILTIATSATMFYTLHKNSKLSFCIMFFIVNIVLLLQLIPVGNAVYADRYAYIASVGYCILVGYAFDYLVNQRPSLKCALTITLSIYLILIGGLAFERCKVWKDPSTLWEDVIDKQPKAVVAWNNRGTTRNKAGRHAEAIKDFTHAINLSPNYADAYYNRGNSKKSIGSEKKDIRMLRDALMDYDKAIQIKPNFAMAFHNRGSVKEILGDLNGAIADFDKAIEYNPKQANSYVSRGVSKGKSGRFTDAVADFDFVIQLFPRNASAYSNRGLAKERMGDPLGAIQDYTAALQVDPDFVTALHNRGSVKRYLKDFDGAIKDFDHAIKVNGRFADAYMSRGLTLMDMGRKEDGCKNLAAASHLGNEYATRQYKQLCEDM